MALLLCTRDARNPFYNEKLDIRIWSLQELCYVIYNHPLLTLHGFVTPELADWLRDELSMGFLAARIRQLMASAPGEGEEDHTDEALTAILRECNYYTQGEIEACRKRLRGYRSCSREDYAQALGTSLFRLRRYHMAYDSFSEAEREVSEKLGKISGREPSAELLKRRADILCDMAAAKIQLLETEEALELLSEAEKAAPSQRGVRMRSLLLMEAGREKELPETLTDEEKKRLSEERAEARKRALERPRYREVKDAFLQDPVRRQKTCGELLKKWKKEYRRMS